MMKLMHLFALLLLVQTPALATDDAFLPNMQPRPKTEEQSAESWHEMTMPLPSLPKDAELIEFVIDGPPSPFRYFIDSRNLLIGADAVVRYILIIESRSGGRNLSYEGIRCTPKGQYKVFAYGANARFTALDGAQWLPISATNSERYHDELWRFHFCLPFEFKPRSKPDILRSLKATNR